MGQVVNLRADWPSAHVGSRSLLHLRGLPTHAQVDNLPHSLRLGYELIYNFPQPTPMILALNIHYTRASDIIVPDHLTTDSATGAPGWWRRPGASGSRPTR